MADSNTNLEQLEDGQPLNRRTANALFDACSPASYWGRIDDVDLTWSYYGGVLAGTRYPNGTLDLDASSTCYLELDPTTATYSFNTTAFTPGSLYRYRVVTGTSGVSSYEDLREGGGGAFGVNGAYNGTNLLLTAPDGKRVLVGPFA